MAAAILSLFYLLFGLVVTRAQLISTNTPVPPLQWINLSPFLQGSTKPPPLRDVSMGYDESSRTLVVFGGESEGGIPQSQTYLLDMNTLTWSIPSPPANLDRTPPGRSSAISGVDMAASNRHAFFVIGGKGSNSAALSDVWAFDFTNRFWSEIRPTHSGPAARWGASGGIDTRTPTIQDVVLPGPNNTMYLAGGFDGTNVYPLSDAWRLNISGILAANLPNDVQATWEKVPVGSALPANVRQGGTIIGQRVVSTGGCSTVIEDSEDDSSCALQDTYVVDLQRGSSITPGRCPAPRLDPVLSPNFNAYSTNFASQVFLALGTVNSTLWDDDDGLNAGEIAVLDVNTGSWSRILPSGDPGSTGEQTYPTPREGAASFSYDRALVGSARNGLSDTIVFGGRDASGKYLSDMWVLRSYRDSLTSSGARWTGYGDGKLQTGPDANGAGVTIQYMTKCASLRNTATTPSNTGGDSSDNGPSQTQPATPSISLDTSLAQKILSSVSLALLLLTFLLIRAIPYVSFFPKPQGIRSLSIAALAVSAYALGVAGFALSFTSLKVLNATDSSSDNTVGHLSTPHSKAALAFFVCLYVVVPLLLAAYVALTRVRTVSKDEGSGTTELRRTISASTGEKLNGGEMTPGTPSINGLSSPGLYSPPASPSPRQRTQSYTLPRRSTEAASTDGEDSAMSAPGPSRGFVVLNRPRGRVTSDALRPPSQILPSSRSLGEIDWLLRRRSLNAVGELDYALSLAHNAERNSAAAETTFPPSLQIRVDHLDPPSKLIIFAYVFAQIGFLGLSVLTIIALWRYAHRALFAVFLAWVVVFYVFVVSHPRRLHTERYLLSLLSSPPRGRGNLGNGPNPGGPPSIPAAGNPLALSPQGHGPYLHTPPFVATRVDSSPGGRPMSMATEDDDDDEMDDDVRQRMIEDEMSRRDVSIITMPKRKLTVANPS